MPKPAPKKTIAVDIDDVLAGLAESFIEFTNHKYGSDLTIDDYDEHWAKVWKIDDEQELYREAEDFFKLYSEFKPIPGAQEALNKLKANYKLVTLSSRRKKLDQVTRTWLALNCPDVFSEIHYSGIWDDEVKLSDHKIELTKGQVSREIGADYLIDDQPKHCLAAAEAGVNAILFGDYAWNRNIELLPNMVRAKDWPEVLEYFDGRS